MDISTVWTKSDIHTWIYPWIYIENIISKCKVVDYLVKIRTFTPHLYKFGKG